MSLAEFILDNAESILHEWESFASRTKPGGAMDKLALRDHAHDILRATARDMGTKQSLTQQADKSQGDGAQSPESDRLNDASGVHGIGRVESGFDLLEVVAEYRALRASVLGLWRASNPQPDVNDLDDITRFNESIDQSLAKAVESYTKRVDDSRRMFLAILSHDLRNPLNAITLSATLLHDSTASPDPLVSGIARSSEVMGRLIDDLLDFARSGLGSAIPVKRSAIQLDKLCADAVDEILRSRPGRIVKLHCTGDIAGEWDASRLRQVVSNLLGNALQHGSSAAPVELFITGEGSEVELVFRNSGPPIPPALQTRIFDPLTRGSVAGQKTESGSRSIGLGLYIARAIVLAHGGTIRVASSAADGTTFVVRLPRREP